MTDREQFEVECDSLSFSLLNFLSFDFLRERSVEKKTIKSYSYASLNMMWRVMVEFSPMH
jgi:hypothetical protein